MEKPKPVKKIEPTGPVVKFYALASKGGGYAIVCVTMQDGYVISIKEDEPEVYAIAISQLNKKIRVDLDI